VNAFCVFLVAYLLAACLFYPDTAWEVLAVGVPTLVLLRWLLTRYARALSARLDAARRSALAAVARRVELEKQLREELEKRCPSTSSPGPSSATPPPRVRPCSRPNCRI